MARLVSGFRMAALVGALGLSAGAWAGPVEYYPTGAPPSARPFSEAVRVDDILYLSGEIGTTESGALASGGLPGEARQVMENIGAKLRKRGLGFDDVFKCTVMLADITRWAEFNAVYINYFKPGRLPARSAFGANGLALGAAVELECSAKFPD
ncbi:RidA family protein [Sphingomonas cavernae]|nr:Rid family hydrolase [Sphingomonas cavernae]